MKKLELLDENSNLIHSIVFEDNLPLYKDAEIKIKNFPKLKYQEFLDHMDDGSDVLIPFNNGKEFIIQNPSQHTMEFINAGKNKNNEIKREEVIGRSYAEVFQTLDELKFVKEISKVNETGKTQKIKMMYYEDNALCASFSKVILKIDEKIYLIVKRESDFNIIYKQEHEMFYNSSQAMAVIQNQKFVRVNETYLKKQDIQKKK